MKTNVLYHGDNLKILAALPTESIDLIYADPPFFTGRDFGAFDDRWSIVNEYIDWLRSRIESCHRILKSTGSFYLHCDSHANFRIRYMLDKIFGDKQFRNEIIWHKGVRGTELKNRYQHSHDMLLYYSKSKNCVWNQLTQSYKAGSLKRYNRTDEHGQKYALISRKKSNGTAYYGRAYLKKEGKRIEDVIQDIPTMGTGKSERTGYPTQKPLALLERIVKASSNPGDVVLDPFCGSGTTLAAADKLGRRWIGIDNSPMALSVASQRLKLKESDIIVV